MAGQRSTVGGRSSSARALVTTRRSSSSVLRPASHEGTCASSAVRSEPVSSPSRYSESRSVHWSVIVPAPSALEMLAERHTGMMQLRFRRAGHDPQHVGDLLVPVPLDIVQHEHLPRAVGQAPDGLLEVHRQLRRRRAPRHPVEDVGDRKSTRLNSSHGYISYAVFCLKKKKKNRKYIHTDYQDNKSQ